MTVWASKDTATPFRAGFLLVPDFTLIGLGSAVDPLRIANLVARRTVYRFSLVSVDGEAVRSSDGIRVMADHSIKTAPELDALFVVGPNPIPKSGTEPIIAWLRRLGRQGTALGGVDTGSYFLAKAGLLDGYRTTIHWEDMGELVDHFPRLIISPKLFEVDRNRCTCSGGIAALDMMVYLIGMNVDGRKLASAVSEMLISEYRGPDERQRIPLRSLVGPANPKLMEAVTLMECNIEELLSMEEIASCLQISSRQLERLFNEHLQCTPSHYYLQVRLNQAQQLLKRTDRSISDIAVACGFASLAHFTNRYGKTFGQSPRVARQQFARNRGQKA